MLTIKNISVSVDSDESQSKIILNNCSLNLNPGQIHVLMGPNGSGKSSLVYTLMGHPAYKVQSGSIALNGQSLLEVPAHVRSQQGLYLSMQQPQIIAGLQVLSYLKEVYALHQGCKVMMTDFMDVIQPLLQQVGLREEMLYRSVNDGFSGGEKKRFELLQMMLLKPKVCLLDEIDSGVDVDGLALIAKSLQSYKQQNPQAAMIIVTHYRRILEYLTPDVVHVMINGSIVSSGSSDVIGVIENQGYEQYANRN